MTLAESGTVTAWLGGSLQLNAELAPITAETTLSWSSSNKRIAAVDASGVVTPIKEGSVTITVKTHNGKKDTVKVKVSDPKKPQSVTLAESGTVTAWLGGSLQLNAEVAPITAETTLSWSSSNKRIATVDASGVVTPIKEGSVTITVKTHNGKKDTVKVKVADPSKPAQLVLSHSGTIALAKGETLQLSAQILPDTAVGSVKWSSSKTRYATVDESGLVTAVKAGTVTITAKTQNGKTDTVKIKIL